MATKKATKKASNGNGKGNKTGKPTRPSFDKSAEGKHTRFKFYATLRVNKAIKLFKQLGNLSNKTIYSATDNEITQILTVLDNSLIELRGKLTSTTEKKQDSFRLA